MGSIWYAGCRPLHSPPSVQVCRGKVRENLPARLDLWNHSPDGFEWGYGGSGPAQLALALLAHATGRDNLAIAAHQPFKWEVVAKFDKARWRLDRDDLVAWLLEWIEAEIACPTSYTLREDTHNA